MKNILLVILVGIILIVSSCSDKNNPVEQDTTLLTGTWTGTLTYSGNTGNPNPLTLLMVQNENTITGTLIETDEGVQWSFTIINGIRADNGISFSIDEKEQVQEETEYWNFLGAVDDNNLNGTFTSVDDQGESGTWSVIKQ